MFCIEGWDFKKLFISASKRENFVIFTSKNLNWKLRYDTVVCSLDAIFEQM